MHLVQLLLPLRDNQGEPFGRDELERVQAELTDRFGGATAYLRSPAAGAWLQGGRVDRDEVVMLEVMTDQLDRAWWNDYRRSL
jgi:hypothetical protein